MGRFAKITLVLMIINGIAAALFLTGIVDVSKVPGLYLTFPLAAVLFGMFVIFRAFEKDAREFDAEQLKHHKDIKPIIKPDIQPHNVKSLHDEHNHDKSIAA
jgi:hypothetical protein